MYINLFRNLLEKNTTLLIISLLFILPLFISQQSHAQCIDTGAGTVPDGILQEGEECDDGDGAVPAIDGCSADCTVDPDYFCDNTDPTTPSNCGLGCEITVVKVANPGSRTVFPFLGLTLSLFDPHLTLHDFDLSDPGPPPDEMILNVHFLSATFLTELLPPRWEFDDIVCEPTGANPATLTLFRDIDLNDPLPPEVPFESGDETSIESTFENANSEILIAVCLVGGSATCTYTNNRIPADIPTLSEWGLITMAGVLGIVGFMVIRRRKATA